MDYKKAGVDIEAGYRSVELMKEHVKKTMREEVAVSRVPSLWRRSRRWTSRCFCPAQMDVEQR